MIRRAILGLDGVEVIDLHVSVEQRRGELTKIQETPSDVMLVLVHPSDLDHVRIALVDSGRLDVVHAWPPLLR